MTGSPNEAPALSKDGTRLTAFVSGNFNVLHPGHFRLLRFAAEIADRLVVGVNPDGTPGAVVAEAERLAAVRSLGLIDEAFIIKEPLPTVLDRIRPDVVVKGKEYEALANIEQAVVDRYGGKLLFSSGEMRFSPQALLQDGSEVDFSSIHKPAEFPARHNFKVSELKAALDRFAGLRVLVIGDLIVDTYVNCDPLGMSQEDPTLVVSPFEELTFLGGGGIVAAHARGMGAEVHLISVVGADKEADFARDALARYGVAADLLVDGSRPTTHKRRYRAKGKTLLRVSYLRQHPIEPALASALLSAVAERLDETDLLLFSDFNYGCLPQSVVDPIVRLAQARGVVMAADSQASSQTSDVSRFVGMDLITPTEREARLALQDFQSGLVIIAAQLQQKSNAKQVIVTLGEEGLLVHAPKGGEFHTDRLPAFNTAPRDVAGAGDSLLTTTALALRAGVDIWQSAYLGALAAACQVSRVGNTPLTRAELLAELDSLDLGGD
jgi:rfaE bifunctional protein kinase chain/domain